MWHITKVPEEDYIVHLINEWKKKEKKQIEEAVVVMHPKHAEIVKGLGMKYAFFSEGCEEDKIYLITDEELAQAARSSRDNCGIIERSKEE